MICTSGGVELRGEGELVVELSLALERSVVIHYLDGDLLAGFQCPFEDRAKPTLSDPVGGGEGGGGEAEGGVGEAARGSGSSGFNQIWWDWSGAFVGELFAVDEEEEEDEEGGYGEGCGEDGWEEGGVGVWHCGRKDGMRRRKGSGRNGLGERERERRKTVLNSLSCCCLERD